jgi:hypothetical protein
MQETDRQIRENARQMKERQAETDRLQKENALLMKELRESQIETARQIKEVNQTVGAWGTNHGAFAEDYFFNSFEKGQRNFFGEKFDEIEKNLKGPKVKADYDIVLINGKIIGIIEVKFKAHENDIPKILKKAETFRINFPYYAEHKIYLGLASLAFYPKLESLCTNVGIAIIKQVGDTVVINDEHLKTF